MSKRKKKKKGNFNPTGPRKETPDVQRSIRDQDGRQVLIAFGRERFFPYEKGIEEGDYVCFADGTLEAVRSKDGKWCNPYTGLELNYDPLRGSEEPAEARFDPESGTYERVPAKRSPIANAADRWAGYRDRKKEASKVDTGPKERMVIQVAETDELFDTWWYQDLMDELKKREPYRKILKDGTLFCVWTFPKAQLGWKKSGYRHVATCGFNGTNEFLKHILGVTLDMDDESWYKGHVSTDRHGILLTWIPTVLDQLVQPYGLGISRIRFKKGEYADYVDLAAWQASLGMNPLALAHGPTNTNVDWAVASGLPLEEVNLACRVDFASEPLQPCTIAHVYSGNSDLGHVSYAGPRRVIAPNWQICVQFDRRDRILHRVPLELTPYQGKGDEYDIDWLETRDKDGKLYVDRSAKKWSGKDNSLASSGSGLQSLGSRSGAESDSQAALWGDYWGNAWD